MLACLALLAGWMAGSVQAAHFTDTFSTSPGEPNRKPFCWDSFRYQIGPGHLWRCADGILEYKAEQSCGSGGNVDFRTLGIEVADETAWSLELGFRHVSGRAPRPAYETLAYVTWHADQPGQMRILAAMYDAAKKAIVLYNAGAATEAVQADLSGGFHAVRMTAAEGQVRLFLDGRLITGPLPIRAVPYSQQPGLFIGPVTSGDPHTLCYQFDYLAFSDDGAFAPDDEPGWDPAQDRGPAAEGLTIRPSVLDQPPWPGIKLLKRMKGTVPWDEVIPPHWRRLQQIIANQPRQVERPYYVYPGKSSPTRQNIYRNYMALEYDQTRCVAISHLTSGIDDTGPGFLDYKLWYRISTDGGRTYDEERPLIQSGEGFSPMHPIEYVRVGKNSFCYGSIPPLLKMSNGEILMPIYFAPLDEKGNYYNPVGAFTFTYAAALIGKWNATRTDLAWEASRDIRLSGEQSSRGANECAVIELSTPGHVLMVIRGSNAPNPQGVIPAVKWKTLSPDYGRTWSACQPFTYRDGEKFLSPSSCSAFIRSSKTGKVYWIGNISRAVPHGNSPRYPLVMAELDEEKLGLHKQAITIIDDRGPRDPQDQQLSNFGVVEDPATGNIVLVLDRHMQDRQRPDAGMHTYLIELK